MKNSSLFQASGLTTVLVMSVLTVSVQSAAAAKFAQVSLQNMATALCLDSNNNGQVYAMNCKNEYGGQKWQPAQSGSSLILKNAATGLCLDNNNKGQVYAIQCNDQYAGQKWNMISNQRSDGRYQNATTGLCLDSNNKGQVYAIQCNNQYTGQNWLAR